MLSLILKSIVKNDAFVCQSCLKSCVTFWFTIIATTCKTWMTNKKSYSTQIKNKFNLSQP